MTNCTAPGPARPPCWSWNEKFLGTPLDVALRCQDIRYLIVTGILADVCVNCTLLSAANRDYRVTAVTDGVATLWPYLLQACFDL